MRLSHLCNNRSGGDSKLVTKRERIATTPLAFFDDEMEDGLPHLACNNGEI
ncbi:MAG: hypothetical protein LBS39_00520 [Campylobacteraceae bacterium]|nr:hypothetical protein [Campylobacteraceae bacterium]